VLGTAPCAKPPCTSILRTRDGGASWQGVPAPLAPIGVAYQLGARAVSTIRFADGSNGWVVGRQLFATHNGGSNWRLVPLPLDNGVITGLATGGGRVYLSAKSCGYNSPDNCLSHTTVYASVIGADEWSPLTTSQDRSVTENLVAHGSDWYLTTTRGLYHGVGAAAPKLVGNPCPAEGSVVTVPRIAVADARHLDAMCAGGGAGGSASYQLYGTSDGGLHWSKAGPSRREASGLYGIADNAHGVLLAATASGGSEILRSTDDGATLVNAKISTASGGLEWTDLGFTTTNQAVVVLSHTALYLSHDAGSTWSQARY